MVYKKLKEQDGYTLVEVLIALVILSVITSLVLMSFVFVNNRMADWKDQISFYNQFMISNNQIYNDLINTDYVSHSDTTLSLILAQRQRNYSWSNGKLKLNHNFLGDATDSTWITVQETKTDTRHVISYWITYRRGGRVISDSAMIQIREAIEWMPAKEREIN